MLCFAARDLAAAYLPESITSKLIEQEVAEAGYIGEPAGNITAARERVLPRGYARFTHAQPHHYAFAAPVWTAGDRFAFTMSIVMHCPASQHEDAEHVRALLVLARCFMLIGATGATGPRSPYRDAAPPPGWLLSHR